MARQAWYGGPRKGAAFMPVVHGNGARGATKSVGKRRSEKPLVQPQTTTNDLDTDLDWMDDELILDEDSIEVLGDVELDEPDTLNHDMTTASARQRIEIAAEEAWLRSAISDFDEY